jgi:hypothetical protein
MYLRLTFTTSPTIKIFYFLIILFFIEIKKSFNYNKMNNKNNYKVIYF